jgi:hypothetical protein
MEDAVAIGGTGRHDADSRPAEGRRTMWRIAERVLSVTIAGAAVSGAVYLGVTGPLSSPVSPASAPAPAQAAVTGDTGAAPAPATGGADAGPGPRHGDGGRGDAGGRGRR